MQKILQKYLNGAFRSPEGEGGGSGAGAEGTGSAGADASGAGGSTSGASASDEGAGGKQDGGGQEQGGGQTGWNPQWPDDFPENLRGQDANETLNKVNKALAGYRERDSKRDIPADAKDYLSLEGLKDFEISDDLKPHFEQLGEDPVFQPIAEKAKEFGIERPAFLKLWQTGMEALSQAGMLEPPVDAKAERELLLPEEAKGLAPAEQDRAIDKRMEENLAFVDLMVQNRGLPKEAGEYAQLMLSDRAHGHRFLEWMRSQFAENKAGPGALGSGGGGMNREQLKARMADLEKKRGTPEFNQAEYDALDADYRKLFSGN